MLLFLYIVITCWSNHLHDYKHLCRCIYEIWKCLNVVFLPPSERPCPIWKCHILFIFKGFVLPGSSTRSKISFHMFCFHLLLQSHPYSRTVMIRASESEKEKSIWLSSCLSVSENGVLCLYHHVRDGQVRHTLLKLHFSSNIKKTWRNVYMFPSCSATTKLDVVLGSCAGVKALI